MVFPATAGEFDQIRFFLQSNENVKVYLIETSTYKSTNFEESLLTPLEAQTITWPNEAFILVMANDNSDPTDFTISY